MLYQHWNLYDRKDFRQSLGEVSMGTCHVIMHEKLIEKISQSPYDLIVKILNKVDFGEDGLYQCHVETDVLSEGYHGQQEIIVTEDSVKFRRDTDT